MTIAMILVASRLFMRVFHGPGDAEAIGVSGALAFGAQVVAFVLSRLAAGATNNLMARMGTGAIVRMFTLFGFALLLMAKVVVLPPAAALVSFATFVFLSSLLEPLLIK
jgi:hypothetical protein